MFWMFWEKKRDAEVALVHEAMNRKGIEKIKQYTHFTCNDNLNKSDKFTKVTKLYDIANKAFPQFRYFHLYYSIDKQMVPYTKKCITKQTVSTKCTRFGYKSCVLSPNDGYPYFLDPYCGPKDGEGKVSKHLCACSFHGMSKILVNAPTKKCILSAGFLDFLF